MNEATIIIASLMSLGVAKDDVYDTEEKANKAMARATKKDGIKREAVQVEEGGFYFRPVVTTEPEVEIQKDATGAITGAVIDGTTVTIETGPAPAAEAPKVKKVKSPYPWLKKFCDGLEAQGVKVADLSLVNKEKSILLMRGTKRITWFTTARRQEFADATLAELARREGVTLEAAATAVANNTVPADSIDGSMKSGLGGDASVEDAGAAADQVGEEAAA